MSGRHWDSPRLGPSRADGRFSPKSDRVVLLGLFASAVCACASAPLRGRVSGLGAVSPPRTVSVEVQPSGKPAVEAALKAGVEHGLAGATAIRPAIGGVRPALKLRLHVMEALPPRKPPTISGVPIPLPFGNYDGRLQVHSQLATSGGDFLGRLTWDAGGPPRVEATKAGLAIARALDDGARFGPDRFGPRRASDERLFLTPTALTLHPGQFEVSDDELLLFRFAAGLSRSWQLDAWLGALPAVVPAAGGLPLPGAIIGGAGGVAALASVVDVGLKVQILHETRLLPALSLSYDFLFANLAAVGAGAFGGVASGGGAAGGGVAVADVHAQFNLAALALTKHLGRFQVSLGSYLFDNHHFLPQSAQFAAVVGGAEVGDSGSGAGALPASGGTSLGRVPTEVQPFVSGSFTLGPHSLVAIEAFPWAPLRPVLGTTGVRWTLGGGEDIGPVDLERLTVRIDAALVWMYLKGVPSQGAKPGVGYLPWLGLGLSFD